MLVLVYVKWMPKFDSPYYKIKIYKCVDLDLWGFMGCFHLVGDVREKINNIHAWCVDFSYEINGEKIILKLPDFIDREFEA